jgi:hypothetical protein
LAVPWQAKATDHPANNDPSVNQTSHGVLILTMNDSGRTFIVETGTLINIQTPYSPYAHVYYDPMILQHQVIVEPHYSYPIYGWAFLAIRPGTSPISITFDMPCHYQPCPLMPIQSFSVNMIVRHSIYPPPPPVYLPRTDVYIGTAYLDQTLQVSTGQVLALELPYLSAGQSVSLQFDRAILNLASGQPTNYQQGGWRFIARQRGTTTITVSNGSRIYFRVRIVVS